jgi:acylphosphatase
MQREIECIITGRVQMVMFRDFAKKKANSLGLAGIAENLEDGSVRVVAQGGEESLKKLISHLSKGPMLAKVAEITVEWREPKDQFESFIIRY